MRPVISQSFLANLFIEHNDQYWPHPEYGGESHYWAYDREHRQWHKCEERGCYVHGGMGAWMCELNGEPDIVFRPAVFFELVGLLSAMLETADAATQRRCGSYAFLQGTLKILECHPSIVITREDLEFPPRPSREEEEEARREREDEKRREQSRARDQR